MFEAQYLFKGTIVLGPWMPRQADNFIIHLDLLAITGTSLTVEVLTKNSEDAGDGSPLTGTISTSNTEVTSKEYNVVAEELIRYRFTVAATADDDYAFFRMLPPTWYDTVVTPTG